MFVTTDWKTLSNDEHSSLLQTSVNYGQKSFITFGPEQLDCREKVELWIRNLCEEVSERLHKDRADNQRLAEHSSVTTLKYLCVIQLQANLIYC